MPKDLACCKKKTEKKENDKEKKENKRKRNLISPRWINWWWCPYGKAVR